MLLPQLRHPCRRNPGREKKNNAAQNVEQLDAYFEQVYEGMHPAPKDLWKEQLMAILTALSSILGMFKYMETLSAAASNTKVGFEHLMHLVKTRVEPAYNEGLVSGSLMANIIGMLKSWQDLIEFPTLYSSHAAVHQKVRLTVV